MAPRLARTIVQMWLFMLLAGIMANAAAASSVTERRILQSYVDGEYALTIELVAEWHEQQPDDPGMLYIKARAQALLGEADAAASTLLRAVHAGFRNFSEMARDEDFESIREHPTFQGILEAARAANDRLAEQSLQAWTDRFGERDYRIERDEQRRIIYATALNATAHREIREMLDAQADHLVETLFGDLPDFDVFIAIPTPRHARQLFQQHNVGGSYVHRQRQLVSRDTGGSLRHEFFHVMHYGHMERLGQAHRLWVQEGLASLYEDYELASDGSITFLPNERNEVTHNRARVGRLIPWRSVFELPAERFMARATVLYPQARSMFEFVAAEGKLQAWYEAYVTHFDEDPTGEQAFEVAFGKPVAEVERQWQQWVRQRPVASTAEIQPGRVSLGIGTVPEGANDGILITQVLPGSTAHDGNLQVGDVLIALDGHHITTMNDLRRAMDSRTAGEQVEIRVRRGDGYATLPVELKALNGR